METLLAQHTTAGDKIIPLDRCLLLSQPTGGRNVSSGAVAVWRKQSLTESPGRPLRAARSAALSSLVYALTPLPSLPGSTIW
jgi:hypothetical protein